MKLLPAQKETYPINPGVYRMLNSNDDIIYIGKAKNLRKRLTNYFDKTKKSDRIKLMISEIRSLEVTTTNSENDALVLEQKLINKIKPKYNIIFRDDKSYPFIALSKHEFPKIYLTREKTTKNIPDNLFGPFPKKEAAYKNLESIQKIFKIRTCTDNEFSHRSRPCILHSIGKCSAPCVNKSDSQFQQDYKFSINQSKKILKGQIAPTLTSLEGKMQTYSDDFNYEKAADIRDAIHALKNLYENQTIYSLKEENIMVFNYLEAGSDLYLGYSLILDGLPQEVKNFKIEQSDSFSIEEAMTRYIESEVNQDNVLKIIAPLELPDLFYNHEFKNSSKQYKDWLNLVKTNLEHVWEEEKKSQINHQELSDQIKDIFILPIHSIDCIDISHFSGEATYGGKIRWSLRKNTGFLEKSQYRLAKFNDKIIDDVAHINQSVEKIYHDDNDIPSILIIDGDKPQLQAAFDALTIKNLHKDFILMSSAKGVSRKKGVEIFYVHSSCQQLINPVYLTGEILNLPDNHRVRLLIQHVQDSAHNFANSARKKKMSKDRFKKK